MENFSACNVHSRTRRHPRHFCIFVHVGFNAEMTWYFNARVLQQFTVRNTSMANIVLVAILNSRSNTLNTHLEWARQATTTIAIATGTTYLPTYSTTLHTPVPVLEWLIQRMKVAQ